MCALLINVQVKISEKREYVSKKFMSTYTYLSWKINRN